MSNLGIKKHWKVFLVSFLLIFGATVYAKFFRSPGNVKSPVFVKINIWDQILPKLKQKVNDFSLSRERSFIPIVEAGASFDKLNSYLVIDFESGKIIKEKDFNKPLPIASLTKIMTAVVALDLAFLDEYLVVSKKASLIEPTKIGVVPGQRMKLDELLHALILTSANDSAEVLKEGIDQKYGEEIFIRAMNEKAKIIGLKNTHFTNPQGFDDFDHFSSAEDLAVLSHFALTNYSKIAEIARKDYHFLASDNYHKQFDLYNWNGLINVYPGIYGLKIGNTGKAKHTTVVLSERDGRKVLVVLLGAETVLDRDLTAAKLLDLGFENIAGLTPVGVNEVMLDAKYKTWKYWN